MRIGLFGGTYNPIHFGHLRSAIEIKEEFALDKIYFIPSALPPHKDAKYIIDASYRLEMIKLSVADNKDFIVSDIELKRLGPSYTIDTVFYFLSNLPKGTKTFLIVGLDAFLEIDTWKSYKELFSLISFIVILRPDINNTCNKINKMGIIEDFIKYTISSDYSRSSEFCYTHSEKKPIFVFNITQLDISSTKIRNLIKMGKSIKFIVPEKVEDFIFTKGLYI